MPDQQPDDQPDDAPVEMFGIVGNGDRPLPRRAAAGFWERLCLVDTGADRERPDTALAGAVGVVPGPRRDRVGSGRLVVGAARGMAPRDSV